MSVLVDAATLIEFTWAENLCGFPLLQLLHSNVPALGHLVVADSKDLGSIVASLPHVVESECACIVPAFVVYNCVVTSLAVPALGCLSLLDFDQFSVLCDLKIAVPDVVGIVNKFKFRSEILILDLL